MKYTHIRLVLFNTITGNKETYVFPIREVRHVLTFFIEIVNAGMECTITIYNENTSDDLKIERISTLFNIRNLVDVDRNDYRKLFQKVLKANRIPLYPREYTVNINDRLVYSETLK